MATSNEKQPAWNIWGKVNVKTARSAPVILFDESSRKEYVTGFSKRKMQRKMVAQAAIKMKEKQMRAEQRKLRKQEADEYIAAITEAKKDPLMGDGAFIDARDEEQIAKDKLSAVDTNGDVDSTAVYDMEDGGKVTATVSTFDDEDSDSEEMPGLIPLSQLTTSANNMKSLPSKPKLKGKTDTPGISSSLKSKKRRHEYHDRKGFHKKAKR